jgi:hypothetical protein
LWLFDLATAPAHQLAPLANTEGRMRIFDITPDGTHIVFDRRRANSDIVLIDVPK